MQRTDVLHAPGGHGRATIPAMTTRRGARPTHVRPRPPTGSRPTPTSTRTRPVTPGRIATHRPISRSRGLPLIVKLTLVLAVATLGIGVIYVGAGGLRTMAAALGDTFSGFVTDATTTPSPSPSVLPLADAPILVPPAEPYTSSTRVDLAITLPSAVVGKPEYKVRIYLALKDQIPSVIDQVAIGDSQRMIYPAELVKGINDFSVTIVGPAGESDTSPVVRYILDQGKPKITITSPEEGAKVNGRKVTIKGKVQARSTLVAKNADNDASISGTAEADGTFTLSLALTTGTNHITITATDPAGNATVKTLTVKRGTGQLTVNLSASDYVISRRDLPYQIRIVCLVTDPDGNPLPNAAVTFTLSIPGIQTITQDAQTDGDGRASFETSISKGAERGQGSATVLVSSDDHGSTSDLTVITITK